MASVVQAPGDSDASGDDTIRFLLSSSAADRVAFLGLIAVAKTTVWAATVATTARCRQHYTWAFNAGVLRDAQKSLKRRFPQVSAAAAAAAGSAATAAEGSKSLGVLARLLRVPRAELLPAAAEGTLAFRALWMLWLPCQCWAMLRLWPCDGSADADLHSTESGAVGASHAGGRRASAAHVVEEVE